MRACNQCGRCCLHYADGGLVATRQEIEHWELHRPDIYAHVRDGQIWYSPQTGQALTRCPWLVGESAPYQCSIYEDRPEDCRSYPSNISDMIRDECEMLEPGDLKRPDVAALKLLEFSDR